MLRKSKALQTSTLLERIDLVLTRSLIRRRSELGDRASSRWKGLIRSCRGVTLLELMVAMMGVATLVGMALPVIEGARDDIRLHQAVISIEVIQFAVTRYELKYHTIPANTAAMNLPADVAADPWGNPYVYLNHATPDPSDAKPREDQFLKPVNSAYDIYSMDPNGETFKNFSNWRDKDDIVRASDGQ
jgi:general secretion pathway protein G